MTDDVVGRRRFLNRLSLALAGLAGVVVAVPIVSYLLSPLLRPAPDVWTDVGPASQFPDGQTVLRAITEPSSLPWAGQTSDTAIWVRRVADQSFTVFAVNCTHL